MQVWCLCQTDLDKLDVLQRNFLPKMVQGGSQKHDPQNGDLRPVINNERLYEITGDASLSKFIHKQFLKHTAHVCRMQNDSLQKQLLFIHTRAPYLFNIWLRCQDLLGGRDIMAEEQLRKKMMNKGKFLGELNKRFGTRVSNS